MPFTITEAGERQRMDLLAPPNYTFSNFVNETFWTEFPANIYLIKVNNRNTRKWCEICSKLTIKTSERRH